MATYTFKSVGKTQTQVKNETITTSQLPIGIVSPMRTADDGSLLQMTYSLSDQVDYNLRDLLMTNWGERLTLYKFGANLKPLCSEFQTLEDFDSAVMQRMRDAISMWMPYIELEDYSSELEIPDDKKRSYISKRVKILISYSISQLKVQKKMLQITLDVI